MALPIIDVAALSPEERLDLMSRIWETFARSQESLPVTVAQAEELDRRLRSLDAGTMPTIPWKEIQARHSV
jgi:putative addiction module component (TIGR02574 family)